MKYLTATASLALAIATPSYAQDIALEPGPAPAPMTAQDLVTAPRLGGATVSPDGRYAVYPVTTTDGKTYERTTTHYVLDLGTASAAPITLDLGDASAVEFGADGWLYFLSNRGDKKSSQLWRANVSADGTVSGVTQVTSTAADIAGFKLAPNANRVAVWGNVARSCTSFGCDAGATHEPGPGKGRLYDGDGGFYRHWDSWESPGVYSRVFAFNLRDGAVDGDPVALDGPLTEGALIGDTPTQPFGGGEEIAWSADSNSVYFVARQADASEPVSTDLDIYQADLANRTLENITVDNEATDTLPTPSPDGRWLAWAAMARPGYESDRLVVQLRDVASGETRALTQDWDRSVGSLAWTPDSRFLIATAAEVLDTPAFRIDPETGVIERLDLVEGNEAHLGNVTPLSGGRILFARDSIQNPAELYLRDGNGPARRLTDVAFSKFASLAEVETTRFSFAGAGGAEVWGQLHKPSWIEGPMPVVLYVHGGPQGSFNDVWSSRWNARAVASQGYAVVSIDFHGSAGYGQDFMDAINGDWGGKPLLDLQLGMQAAIESDPQLDGNRACAMGASYGGYMMNWIAGNWPDGFRCLVQHDGLFDLRSFYYSTEELWFPRWDFRGSYSQNAELYERWNPVNYVDNWRTPMLVIAGEKDFRVPYTQGLQSFTALQERGIPSQLLVFPDENHWVLGRENSLQWHQTVFAWLDRWLKE